MKSYKYKFQPYYIIRPRTWQKHLKAIDLRTAVSPEWGYTYIRIPKAANSTIIRTLQHNFPDTRITSDHIGTIKKEYLHFSDFTFWQSLFLSNRLFIFTIVRNPYSRILSAYLNKLADRNMAEFAKYSEQVSRYDEGQLSFSGFCRYLADGGEQENPHWMRQSRILSVSDRIDYIGKVEYLEKDLDNIVRRISTSANLNIERKGEQTNATEKLQAYYDNECRHIVEEIYAQDFSDLGYAKEF
ncbi:sulfotransferase family 2 domain-containing protein [Fodinicurvata halophila]|uniref:Sulfotransferase family 2 domain-containing protein n=1 Tax=Fodinicurvata halophila TaxID=1419723 RepID=A0ABV8ULP5_9PROT